MTDRVGHQLGHYRLLRLLGQGGFADVYLAEHVHLETQVAIKVLSIRLTGENVEQFRTEARTVARLVHPHIVRVLDFGVEDGTPYLVMDYAPGGTLRMLHPKGTRLPLPTIVTYVKQVAEALQYAHERKLIHRDMKPENMLLGEHGQILLSDFGIALVAQSTRYQNTQEVIGTAAYMAPEQLQGKPRRASDQYALGIVVYEWLCGDRPFHGTFTELYSQHLFVPPPPLHKKVPKLSPQLEQVVQTALAKDPKERFATVQAFATAVEQACLPGPSHPVALPTENLRPSHLLPSSHVIAAIPPAHSSDPTKRASSLSQSLPTNDTTPLSPLPPTTVMATLPSISAARPPSREETVSFGEPQSAKRGISRRGIMGGLVGVAGLAVAGSGITWFVYFQRSQGQKPLGSSTGSTITIYRGHSGAVYAVAWSPDGKHIASASNDQTVQIWDAMTSANVLTYKGHSDMVSSVAWSPDGMRIASGSADGTVQVWNARDGSQPFTYRGHSHRVEAVAWSPDGKHIASGGYYAIVQVWDSSTGNTIYTLDSRYAAWYVPAVAWSPDGKYIALVGHDAGGVRLEILEASSGNTRFIYAYADSVIHGVTWAPDSIHVAYGSNSDVPVLDSTSGNTRFTYHGHSRQVYGVAWSPNGRNIASASLDKTVQIWDATSGNTRFTYHGHVETVNTVAWSPDGSRIASGSSDETVHVWQAV